MKSGILRDDEGYLILVNGVHRTFRDVKEVSPTPPRASSSPASASTTSLGSGAVPALLAEHGVRLVIVEGLPNAKIDGVCHWLSGQTPVIGMTLRFDRVDNFWFVLWHELMHVLNKHGQKESIIDVDLGIKGSVSPEEQMQTAVRQTTVCLTAI